MNYKEIIKEFDKLALKDNPDYYDELDDYKDLKDFLKAKINQVINEMIGEEMLIPNAYYSNFAGHPEDIGKEDLEYVGRYQKQQELKEYKRKFNL